MSADDNEADPDKVKKIREWPKPSSPEDMRRNLGFCGYYRKYVKGFSNIVRALNALLPPTRITKRNHKSPKSDVTWRWDPDEESAFQKLKYILSSPPILGYPDYDLPFHLHTDAGGHELYQNQYGLYRVISYASHGLTKPSVFIQHIRSSF